MTNKEETDVTESQIVRVSVLESHGWSSEQNRSQCKFRIQEINSLVFFCYLNFFLFVRASCFLFYVTPAWLPRFMRSHSQPLTYGAYALDNVTLLRWPTRPASISSWTFTLLGSSQPYYRVVSLASKRTVLDDIQSAIRLCQNRKSLTPQIEKVYLAISDKSC